MGQTVEFIIERTKSEFEEDLNFKKLEVNLETSTWGMNSDIPTFTFQLSNTTFRLLDNEFSYHFSREDKSEGKVSYEKYLTKNEIQSLSFFDYSGEKIHRLFEQNFELLNVKSQDLKLVSHALLNYLNEHDFINPQANVKNELEFLFSLSSILEKYDINITVFNPY